MIQRAVKIRLYPTREQATCMNKLLGTCRYVYNTLLALKNDEYKNNGRLLGLCELSKHYHGVLCKSTEQPWIKAENTKVIKQEIRHLLTAFNNFFQGKSNYPKFHCKKDGDSCTFPIETISKKNTFQTKHISLIKSLKDIKFRCSNLQFDRLQRYKDKIKNATLLRTKTNKYYLSVHIEFDENEFVKFKRTYQNVGIDLGVKDFVITSDGEVFENKHFFKKQEKKIKRLNKRHSKKKDKSRNKEKARLCLARAYEKLSNQRMNYIHEIVNSLLREYDNIFIEDLNIQGMLKNHNLAKAISEIGLGNFITILTNKALQNNKRVIKIGRFFPSSKRCNKCGYTYKHLTLNERAWKCSICGEEHDRNLNAALNILFEGERIIGIRNAEYKPVDYPTMDDRCESNLKSSDRLKQEVESEKDVSFS